MKEYGEKTDQVLVELTLLGNEQAFAELVTRHEKAVKGTAFKVTRNPWSAEDAAQDAFVSAWMQLDALNDRSRFGSWVCAIAKNCARDLLIHYRNTVPDISLQIPDEGDLPAAAFAKEEERRELHDAVGTLAEKIRDVVRLHYFEGYSVDEIAAKLSLPAGTVLRRSHPRNTPRNNAAARRPGSFRRASPPRRAVPVFPLLLQTPRRADRPRPESED